MINKQFEKYLSNEPPGEIILRGANIGRYEFYEVPKQGPPVYLNKENISKNVEMIPMASTPRSWPRWRPACPRTRLATSS
jgi:hypothetical protein